MKLKCITMATSINHEVHECDVGFVGWVTRVTADDVVDRSLMDILV